MKEIKDSELGFVGGGASQYTETASDGVCGKYFARDGKEKLAPSCEYCIHSARGRDGRYICVLD